MTHSLHLQVRHPLVSIGISLKDMSGLTIGQPEILGACQIAIDLFDCVLVGNSRVCSKSHDYANSEGNVRASG